MTSMASVGYLTDAEFPALVRAAETAALRGCGKYLSLFRSNLVVLVAAALIGAILIPNAQWQRVASTASATLFAFSVVLGIFVRFSGNQQHWYHERAMAESAKSMTWKYLMGADPYSTTHEPLTADQLFLEDLQGILRQTRDLAGTDLDADPQITQAMRHVRQSEVAARLELYRVCRISRQRQWYTKKATESRNAGNVFYLGFLLCQGMAFVFAVLRVAHVGLGLNLPGVFAALATSIIAWHELLKYQEVAQSYVLAAQDLGFVEARVDGIKSQEELAQFVSDAENAISREHTLWRARRNVQ
jgi:hypothetical protein